jgi:copper chaperone CopZ
MSEEIPDETGFQEPMVARIEVENLGSAISEKAISDALRQVNGVSDVTIAKDAVHVTYDPMQTSEIKIEEAIRKSGNTVTAAETDREMPHADTAERRAD